MGAGDDRAGVRPDRAGEPNVKIAPLPRRPTTTTTTTTTIPAALPVQPRGGPLAGGILVHLLGTGFTGATAVGFGGVAAPSFTVESDSRIVAVAPPAQPGSVDVSVTLSGGTTVVIGRYEFLAAPTLTSVSPGTAPADSDVRFTLTGTNFVVGDTQVEI